MDIRFEVVLSCLVTGGHDSLVIDIIFATVLNNFCYAEFVAVAIQGNANLCSEGSRISEVAVSTFNKQWMAWRVGLVTKDNADEC